MAKSIPRNLSAGLFSTVWFSQQNKRLAKYFPDGSRLTVTDFSFQSDGIWRWSFILMTDIFGSFRLGILQKGYFRLVHWSYMNFLHASLIYNVEIRRLVPEKTSGTHFPDAAAHSPGQGNPPPSAMDIPFYIRPVCSGASFFLSGNSWSYLQASGYR